MAKNDKKQEVAEMTTEEARALRASKHNALPKKSSDLEKREAFRLFWAQEKYKYGKEKNLEPILWVHLKAIQMDSPEHFKKGLAHFGLKEIS